MSEEWTNPEGWEPEPGETVWVRTLKKVGFKDYECPHTSTVVRTTKTLIVVGAPGAETKMAKNGRWREPAVYEFESNIDIAAKHQSRFALKKARYLLPTVLSYRVVETLPDEVVVGLYKHIKSVLTEAEEAS